MDYTEAQRRAIEVLDRNLQIIACAGSDKTRVVAARVVNILRERAANGPTPDPPYGIKYNSNFQQRVDSTKNDDKGHADDVLTIKAFRDTWAAVQWSRGFTTVTTASSERARPAPDREKSPWLNIGDRLIPRRAARTR